MGLIFSRFSIKMNSSFIVYSCLERISTKWNANSLASLSKQIFIINFNASCNLDYSIAVCINNIGKFASVNSCNKRNL